MVDAIGAERVNKLRELELQKQMQQQQAQKAAQQKEGEAAPVPKGVQEVSQAMAASQNDAVQYQAQPGSAEALTAQPNQMQTNVVAVQEADEIMKNEELKTQDKTIRAEEPQEESIVAPEAPPEVGAVKTEDTTGDVKEKTPESPASQAAPPKAPAKPDAPETKEEERIKDPGKAEANISADAQELLRRKERKGIPPQ